MSPWILGFAAVAATLPVGTTGAPRDTAEIRVVDHSVTPRSSLLGASATERLVVLAPRGVRISLVDDDSGDRSVERMGVWHPERSTGDDGRVRWTWSAPVIAWEEGAHTTPPLRILARTSTGFRSTVRVPGASFLIRSPLPGDARVLRAAPPRGGWPEKGDGWPVLVAALQIALAVGTGLAWWRSGRTPRPVEAPEPEHRPATPALGRLLADADVAPARVTLALARAVRRHPRLARLGVGDAHSRTEITRRLTDEDELLSALGGFLALADVVAYAGHVPTGEEVRAAAGPAVEVLGGD